MKDAEDEAFDELAKRQGHWGGGFQAKRNAAMDKINSDFDKEYKKSSAVLAKYRIDDDDDIQDYKRPWVGLTEEDFSAINQSCLTKLQAATSAESILKKKNS
jgi:hypothetical protein